jgi:hypothetical protein
MKADVSTCTGIECLPNTNSVRYEFTHLLETSGGSGGGGGESTSCNSTSMLLAIA